jgi:hypothetical protein
VEREPTFEPGGSNRAVFLSRNLRRASSILCLLGISVSVAVSVLAAASSQDEVIAQIQRTFSTDYAPAAYKQQLFGWNLSEQIARLRTNHLSRASVLDFFANLRDIHSHPIFKGGGSAVWLGVHIKKTKSGYYVAWVEPSVKTILRPGDQVLSFDGIDTADAVSRVRTTLKWHSTPDFEQSFAEWFLTFRANSDFVELPPKDSQVKLTFRRGSNPELKSETLVWLDDDEHPPSRCPFWGKTRNGFLPPLGNIVWDAGTESLFRAYVFQRDGKSFGYLRLHTFELKPEQRLRAIEEVDKAVAKFNEHKVQAVVLDETGNGGGHFLFAFTLLSRFVEKPMRAPLQRFLVDRNEVVGFGKISDFEKTAEGLAKTTTDAEAREVLANDPLFRDNLNFMPRTKAIADDYREFLHFLIEDAKRRPERHLCGPIGELEQWVRPSEGERYSGKMLMMTDELDFSAAEYAAAIFKDNNRGRLLGVTTAGGGCDQRHCKINDDDLLDGFTYTVTLGERVSHDGKLLGPIENVGVAPDYECRISDRDLRSNFSQYAQAVVDRLN